MDTNKKVRLPKVEIHGRFGSLSQVVDWGLKQMNVPDTWSVTQGEGITVMVIDTGHPEHPDLEGNVSVGRSFIAGEPMVDENGHQTHCTGIICAKNNEFGMVGVAPKAKSISVKALSRSGSGSYQSLVDALDYAIEVKPDLISMSLGGNAPSSAIESRVKKLYAMDIPIVCAAGNTGTGGVNWPAAYDETIAVAAYDKYGNIANFSSRGSAVEWAAPGVNIYSTFLDKGYAGLSGTSMACPFISGVIALMLAKHKKQEAETGNNDCKTIEQIREHLLKYTEDKGTIGRDAAWGYGVVDVVDLILGDKEEEPPPIPHPYPDPDPKPECPLPEPCPEAPCPDYPDCKPADPEPDPECGCPFPPPCPWPHPCPPCPEYPEEYPVVDKPKKSKKLYFIIGGVIVVGIMIALAVFGAKSKFEGYLPNLPEVPYLDKDGNVDWDKKYELEDK
jgi:hypothetical protein